MKLTGHLETHLRQAQDIANVGSWQLDVRSGELFWSEECYRIFGLSPDEPISYERFLERVHPADIDSVRNQWNRALEGASYDIEHRIIVDDSDRWVREKAEVQFDDSGNPIQAIGVVKDITEQKSRERRLQSLGTRYKTLIEAAPDPIFLADAETGTIVEANSAAVAFLGRSHDEIIGMPQSELHPPGEGEAYRELFKSHIETEGARRRLDNGSQIFAVTADGERVPVEINAKTMDLPDGQAIFGIFRDISDQVERERELRVFKKAVEAAGHSIYITDTDGNIEYVNPAFESNTGYPAEIAVSKNPRILKSGEHPQSVYERLWETILDGEVWDSEMVNRKRDGTKYPVNQTIAPVRGDDGSIDRFVAVNSDITELKQRAQMLEAERDRAEALRQRLSVVNRIIRHDIRSAVNVIKGNADLAGSIDDTTPDPLTRIQQEADRLYEIAENMRLIEKSFGGGSRRTTLDLAEIIDTTVTEFADRYPKLDIHTALPRKVPVRADNRLDAAIENVFENAVVHNDSPDPTIWVDVESNADDQVEIRIADDGPGIPDGELDPLGEDIERPLHHTSGLGLWIVYWVLKRSGGSIDFEANEPRGTVISMILPQSEADD